MVVSGLGQGSQFLALEWVARELRDKLNLTPFPGTLNLRVSRGDRDALFARRHQFTRIADSPTADCPGYLTPVTLRAGDRAAQAYLILPEKTHYTDVLEFIAASRLRDILNDGDLVAIEVG